MSATDDDGGVGRRWPELPRRRWSCPDGPLLVICPHPDDEVLGCGGLIANKRRNGETVEVVACTDGEAAYPEVWHPHRLADVRRGEHRAALDRLGVDTGCTQRLGLPDGGLTASERSLTEQLRLLLADRPPETLVIAPWVNDGHPDHDACGRAAAAASAVTAPSLRVISYVVWGWFRPAPPGVHLLEFHLDRADLVVREQAMRCHVSQLAPESASPILGAAGLDVWCRPTELYVGALNTCGGGR